MEIIRLIIVLAIVLGVAGMWVYKLYYYSVAPIIAPLAISVLYLCCAFWIFFEAASFWQILGAYALTDFLCRPLHSILARIDLRWVQKRRDEKASRIIETNSPIPFALYLRPFAVTDRLGFYGASSKWGGIDLEILLAQACRSWGEFLALGQPGEAIGAGRILSSESAWKQKFYALAERARIVIVVIAPNDGTFFEIEWLTQNRYLGKTVFVMPPRTKRNIGEMLQIAFTPQHGCYEKDYARNWEHARERLASIGLRFPPYSRQGALIRFTSDQGSYTQYDFGEGVPAIRKVLEDRLSFRSQKDITFG